MVSLWRNSISESDIYVTPIGGPAFAGPGFLRCYLRKKYTRAMLTGTATKGVRPILLSVINKPLKASIRFDSRSEPLIELVM